MEIELSRKPNQHWHAAAVGLPPAEVVRAAYAAYNRGALDELGVYVASDVDWHVPQSALYSGPIRGVQELLELLRSELDAFSEIRREPLELEERGENVVGTIGARLRGRSSGVVLEVSARYAFTVRDGRIAAAEPLP